MADSGIERGAFFIFLANAIFFFSGYAIYFGLGRVLGPKEFGVYGVIISLASLVSGVIMAGFQQAVSKFSSERPEESEQVKGTALRLQLFVSVAVFISYFLLSPFIALLFNDPSLTGLIRLSSFIILFHPMFSIFTGELNGLKRFARQARLLASYSIAKVFFILLFALIGYGVFGAVFGFILSSFFGLVLGFALTGFSLGAKGFSGRKLASFALPVIGFAFVSNTLLNFDLFAVKALSPASVSSSLAGFYTAAGTIAKLPLGFIDALLLVLFPLVSSSSFANDHKKSGFYLSSALRYAFLFLAPLTAITATSAASILAFIYGANYLPGAFALSILSVGALLMAMAMVVVTAISSSNRPKASFGMGFFVMALDIALNFILIPIYSLEGAAAATLISGIAALSISLAYSRGLFSELHLGIGSFLKIFFASLAIAVLSLLFQAEGIVLVLKYCSLFLVYAGILWLLREISDQDFNILKRMAGR
ncbi:MAG: oligosaccharide flippase family protein [Candidatus Diapherotrites archaeon]